MTESVCILRLSALGDCTHVLPLALALRDRGTQVTWVIGKLEYQLLKKVEGIEFIIFDKKQGWAGLAKLRRDLAGRRFDTLLLMQLSARAGLVSTCIKARRRIGYPRSLSREFHGLFVRHRVAKPDGRHVIDVFRQFAKAVGIDKLSVHWDFGLDSTDTAFVDEHLGALTRPLLAISPCSSHVRRNWLAERYSAVADAATQEGWTVVLVGGPSAHERLMADHIKREARLANIVDLTGKDTLTQLVAVLQHVDCVIAPDTGPIHIANAVGTTAIGLYAATDPVRSGPYRQVDNCVNRYPEAARQYQDGDPDELPWGTKIEREGVMQLITVDDVLEQLRKACPK